MSVSAESPNMNQPARTPVRVFFIVAVVLAVVGVGTAVLLLSGILPFGPHQWNGLVMTSTQPVPNFTLWATDNRQVSLRDYRGKIVVLYFGYTHCPDVCPASMVELKKMMVGLDDQADEVQVIMVSVDPGRDTPEKLQEYVSYFNPSFLGLTGTEEELLSATTPLGIYYAKTEGTAASGYLLDHTATISILDRDGYLRLVYPFGTTGDEIAADLRYLIKE